MDHVGRPPDLRRKAVRDKYQLSFGQQKRLTTSVLDQLDRCADDDARWVLLKQMKTNLPERRQMTISEVYGDIEIK